MSYSRDWFREVVKKEKVAIQHEAGGVTYFSGIDCLDTLLQNWRALSTCGVYETERKARIMDTITCYEKALGVNPNERLSSGSSAMMIGSVIGNEE